MVNLNDALTYIPEDKWNATREGFSKLTPEQQEDFVTRLVSLKKAEAEKSWPTQPTPTATPATPKARPKNNPMGNKLVGVIAVQGGEKPVYQNSKGQYYYFTGNGGAAIIGKDKFNPIQDNVDAEIPNQGPNSKGIGNDMAGLFGAGVGGIGGTLYWLNKIRQNNKAYKAANNAANAMTKEELDAIAKRGAMAADDINPQVVNPNNWSRMNNFAEQASNKRDTMKQTIKRNAGMDAAAAAKRQKAIGEAWKTAKNIFKFVGKKAL